MTALHRTPTRPLPAAAPPDGHGLAVLPREEETWLGELVPDPVAARASLARGNEETAVQLALRQGVTDPNRLADLVFQGRHPERGGRPIARTEPALIAEWLSIRDHLVAPLLARRPAAPGPAAPPAGPFRPVPVESPGGARIRDKRDPAPADVVNVRGVNGDVPLHRLAAQAWAAMVGAARAQGIASPLLLPVSGYRSSARQKVLWERALARYHSAEEANKWVARPGGSAHQSGRAIDLYLGLRNDSANVANLRQTAAYKWLVANARRFGFYPYEREPWHWEYNPPAAGSATAGELGPAGVRAGRLEVATVPVLARHTGTAPALVLRWNDMASRPAEIDVVVHLHGYSRPWMHLPRDIEPYSGLDLAPVDGAGGRGRSRPTLTVLPRARYTGVKQQGGNLYVYTFPDLDGTSGRKDGLARLIRFSLDRFAATVGGTAPRVGRLILTAHSGGGLPLLRILRFQDPDEVHVFDGLYWDAAPLVDWARRRIRRDRAGLAAAGAPARAWLPAHGGALRVFYRPGTRRHSRQVLDAIATERGVVLGDWYRVEASSYGHWEIPRNYGWRVLADAAADVPRATRTPGADRELEDAAGQGQPAPTAAQFARGTRTRDRMALLVPLLERHRGDIPLEFLLGWIAVESDGRIDEVTNLDERGFFQIHPDESRDRGFQHRRLSTDPDYSVKAGIENLRFYARLTRRRFPSTPAGSELFWRVVKLQHAMGSGLARQLLQRMLARNIPLTWEAIKRFEVTDGPRLHRLLRVRPLGRFGRNVDEVFTRGRRELAGLRGRQPSGRPAGPPAAAAAPAG